MSAVAATMQRVRRGPREVAWLGVLLGILAFFFALPPVDARGVWVPMLVGLLGAACGIWSVTRGVGRLAWGAIVVGLIGIVLGVLATNSSQSHLHIVVSWGALIASTLVWATHNLFQARRVAQRVALLLDGRLVETAPTQGFFESPRDPRTAAFVRGEMVY